LSRKARLPRSREYIPAKEKGMQITVTPTPIEDVLIVEHQVFEDDRGFFLEAYREDVFAEAGLPARFVQLNHSRSARNVLRGLHFQWEPPMGKLMRVIAGKAFLVAVDIRKGSPTLGKWVGVELDSRDRRQVWAPAGFARGFCVLSDFAEIEYLCTGTYNGAYESGIRWNDPDIGIEWPIADPILSDKDASAKALAEWLRCSESDCFRYAA
jgi:dTDP-4-dehydrorhamnose 3,5-epimerase